VLGVDYDEDNKIIVVIMIKAILITGCGGP
jgi:hypothetical protein